MNLDKIFKRRDITLLKMFSMIKAMIFPVIVYGCDNKIIKKMWVMKHWCFWTVELGKTLENPLDYNEFQPVNAKGKQLWIFIGRTNAEVETPIVWPTDVKNVLIRKDPITGKDWRQEEKKMTENEMVGWHHWLDAHEFEQAPGVGEVQGDLACCSPWGCKESNMTEQLNWTEHTP